MSEKSDQPRPHDAVMGGQSPLSGIRDVLEKLEALKNRSIWKLLYAHDCYGNGTFGNINLLINAIRNGHRIRMVIEYAGKDFEQATEAENLWIRKGIVFAQNTSAVSTLFSGDRMKFNDDFSYSMMIVNTTGEMEINRWNGGEPKKFGEAKKKENSKFCKVAVRWFGDVG
ncbi:MAG TPA: hypothetical protein DCL61_12740 [Cyanobacteria bacterium UBA12227]|nr:hypothetical protein [Cyanobacteria bacterium UBA12227]HAX85849.1 hypothetical protein [Cyanobacteria bacterium UBA11370]